MFLMNKLLFEQNKWIMHKNSNMSTKSNDDTLNAATTMDNHVQLMLQRFLMNGFYVNPSNF